MKTLIITATCGLLLAFAQPAFAYGGGDPCESFLGYVLNSCHVVGHPTEKKRMKAGLGVDVPLIIHEKMDVDGEFRANLNTDDFGKDDLTAFAVAKPHLEEGILQTAWGFLAKLNPFNRGE